MKKEEIQKVAQEVFKKVPEAKIAYITSDGQGFVKKNSAQLHKNSNPKGKKLELFEVVNPVKGAVDKATKPVKTSGKAATGATPEDRSPDDPAGIKEKAEAEAKAKAKAEAEAKKKAAAKKTAKTKTK